MINTNSIPLAAALTGNELVIMEQDGVPVKAPLFLVINLPAGTIAAAPTAFTPTVIDHTEIDLAWTGVADNYILESCREDNGAWQEIYSGATAAFNNTDLYGSEDYYYRVKSQVTGEYDSEWVYTNATTDAAP